MKWVNNNLIAHEEFIGMYHICVTKGDTIVRVIKDSMLRLNLKLSDVQGQCFDGTAAMAEKKIWNDHANEVTERENSFYSCYGQTPKLAIGDAIKSIQVLDETIVNRVTT